jgi:hypothetical protein
MRTWKHTRQRELQVGERQVRPEEARTDEHARAGEAPLERAHRRGGRRGASRQALQHTAGVLLHVRNTTVRRRSAC